jgi:outer membrane lipoprotein SlyB
MRNLVLAVSAATLAVPVSFVLPSTTDEAQAQRRYYDRYGNYRGPTWRGRDGRYYCRRSNGTTGLIIGGAAGALIGREIDGGRNRTAGTVVGAVAGALIGREVQRSSRRGRRCR